MFILENFKNIPRSPYGGRQGSNVFFFSNLQRSPWRKKKRGPVARWGGDRVPHSLFKPWQPFPLSFKTKNSGKKRGVMKHRSINIPSIVCNGKYESDQ